MAAQRNRQLHATLEQLFEAASMSELVDALYSAKLLLNDRTVEVPEGTVERLFGLLSIDGVEVLELTCGCIELTLARTGYRDVADKYKEYLAIGLQSPDSRVRNLALMQIVKCLASKEETESFFASNLLEPIVRSLNDPSAQYAERAAEFLCKAAKRAGKAEPLFQQHIVNIYKQLVASDAVVRVRLWNLMVPICCWSQMAFEQFQGVGLLQRMLDDITAQDQLVAMNAVYLVAQLADTQYALEFLGDAGIIETIVKWAKTDEDSLADCVTIGAALKFLGRIGESHDLATLDERFHILDVIAAQLAGHDTTIKTIAIGVTGTLGQSAAGLRALTNSALLRQFVELSARSIGDLRVPCLDALAKLFTTTR
ncbi:26S proteasome non-ATPase regulatory subunit 5 [Thamnocephalis sphaerospora]|uniref:26S proteasome non-ATPase regulatory subunit 5 n=1 Tax=Thamnocephalis sphaerospora TaxID=78915 RepID=A0A4P9XGB8_9FUNG|nr:26S proteasome non-ATPase regulatory subunit 5 [Thamnocephalis sphaerospora]|eukprot:RKP04664.1 26S proteasome non-ATPase regulatory subunit 5 [Thamnocephalis sphaerospora]